MQGGPRKSSSAAAARSYDSYVTIYRVGHKKVAQQRLPEVMTPMWPYTGWATKKELSSSCKKLRLLCDHIQDGPRKSSSAAAARSYDSCDHIQNGPRKSSSAAAARSYSSYVTIYRVDHEKVAYLPCAFAFGYCNFCIYAMLRTWATFLWPTLCMGHKKVAQVRSTT